MSNKHWRFFSSFYALIVVFLLLGTANLTFAQSGGSTTGSVDGNISDSQGAVISGAKVTVRDLQTNSSRSVTTGEKGAFQLVQLSPGRYEVKVEADGFQPAMSIVTINVGTTAVVDLSLNVAGTGADVIEVTANTSVNRNKTESSTILDERSINTLPINRRNFLDFSLTSARVTIDRTPTQGVTSSSGLSFNAQSGRRNNVTIDGLDNNDAFGGSVRSTFSQEAVQEFQVVSDSYSAEFGRAVGGVVNIVTKSGTNDYHGNLFVLNRNDEISARDAFAPIKPPYSQYQFGATLGGPIKKDKVFFFTSFERLTIKQNNIVTISDATAAAAQRVGFFATNGAIPFSLDTTSVLGRLELQLSPNDRLALRYNYGGTFDGKFEPFGGLISDSSGNQGRLSDNAGVITNTYINTNLNLVNESRFLFNKRDQNVLARGDKSQVILFAPEGQVSFGASATSPFFRDENLYQFVDNVSLSRGNNQIKFGVDFAYRDVVKSRTSVFRNGFEVFAPIDFAAVTGIPGLPALSGLQAFDPALRTPQQIGFLTAFSAMAPNLFPGFPNLPLASLPLPVFYQQSFGNSNTSFTGKTFAAFLQDDIKLRPNLLVKLGVRYDINRVDFMPENSGNFSPRIAFSYAPSKAPKLQIHGAYGIFFAGPFIGLSGPLSEVGTGNVVIPELLFPFSIIPLSLPDRRFPFIDQAGQLPPGLPFIPQLSLNFQVQKNLKNNYSQQVTAGVNYRLNENTIVGISYNFVRGIKLLAERNINPVVRPMGNPFVNALFGRVDPTKGDITFYAGDGDSYYHGVTFQIERRLSRRVNFLAHYTFSKAIDNFFDIRIDLADPPNNPLNIRAERGLSSQDIRSRFVFSGVWDLDYTKNKFLEGFKVSTIVNLNSGLPYNLLAGVDLNQNGDNPPGDRPLGIARNGGVLPGFANMDARLVRTIKIKEQFGIEAFVEVFNLFNRTNISEVNRTFPPDAMGNFNLPKQDNGRYIAPPERYTNAFSPRQFQFGAKITF